MLKLVPDEYIARNEVNPGGINQSESPILVSKP
jgi:hypothetical protein